MLTLPAFRALGIARGVGGAAARLTKAHTSGPTPVERSAIRAAGMRAGREKGAPASPPGNSRKRQFPDPCYVPLCPRRAAGQICYHPAQPRAMRSGRLAVPHRNSAWRRFDGMLRTVGERRGTFPGLLRACTSLQRARSHCVRPDAPPAQAPIPNRVKPPASRHSGRRSAPADDSHTIVTGYSAGLGPRPVGRLR
jgi:hypothetical protein